MIKKIRFESVLDIAYDKLAEDVWDGNTFNKKHKDFILNIWTKWKKEIGIEDIKEKAIAIIGSIVTYQYSKISDIDVNVVLDISDEEINKYFKLLPNGNLLPGTSHPVNFYLTNTDEKIQSKDSAYDLVGDKWIKDPKENDIEVPYPYILEIAKFFMDGIDLRISEYERDKKELDIYTEYLSQNKGTDSETDIKKFIENKKLEILSDLDAIHIAYKIIKAFRKEAFEKDNKSDFLINIETQNKDYSVNNMVYKILERFDYIEKLDKYNKIRDTFKQ